MKKVLNMERIDRKLYTDRILSLLGKGEVVVLTGHRRAGKSCILECLAANLRRNDGHVLYVDMENPDYADITDFEQLNGWIKKHISKKKRNYLLIDEVQEIALFEKTLRYWVKQPNVDIVVTGSNAMMLSSDIATVFAGRHVRVHVQSLNYKEFLEFNRMPSSPEALAAYLRWGGLPFLCNIPADDVRTRIDYL